MLTAIIFYNILIYSACFNVERWVASSFSWSFYGVNFISWIVYVLTIWWFRIKFEKWMKWNECFEDKNLAFSEKEDLYYDITGKQVKIVKKCLSQWDKHMTSARIEFIKTYQKVSRGTNFFCWLWRNWHFRIDLVKTVNCKR